MLWIRSLCFFRHVYCTSCKHGVTCQYVSLPWINLYESESTFLDSNTRSQFGQPIAMVQRSELGVYAWWQWLWRKSLTNGFSIQNGQCGKGTHKISSSCNTREVNFAVTYTSPMMTNCWSPQRISRMMGTLFCYNLNYDNSIPVKFCIWHDSSCVVAACAKCCSNIIHWNEITSEQIFIELELRCKHTCS